MGRFTSVDVWKGGIVDVTSGKDIETNTALPYADITNPQSLNKYAYVMNNPLRYTDPTGHTWAEFWDGAADTSYRPVVQALSHPLDTVVGIGTSLLHPIDTLSAIGSSVVATGQGVLAGDSRALGEVARTAASALVTAGELSTGETREYRFKLDFETR